ncbi:hypothetical protein EVAR_82568_1 [Eumeta japonica]|uniref:Uncharacterized protein n=1 Tax=Eumeta variegata TaxID=151549 RepID=A0A4C1UXT6_EUMVA|nr:hypothetical protein EVAR_82568_1 [Eumeta japonica]
MKISTHQLTSAVTPGGGAVDVLVLQAAAPRLTLFSSIMQMARRSSPAHATPARRHSELSKRSSVERFLSSVIGE